MYILQYYRRSNVDELTADRAPFLPFNEGDYEGDFGASLEAASRRHLEIHFRLLRHEMVAPLQEGLRTALDNILARCSGGKRHRKKHKEKKLVPPTRSPTSSKTRASRPVSGIRTQASTSVPVSYTHLTLPTKA